MKLKNILLTGDIQVGKSTIINKIIDRHFKDKKVSGFKTLEFSEGDVRQGFYMEDQLEEDVSPSPENIVGRLLKEEQRCFGITETFENKGVEILNSALESKSELILIDELGFFESQALNFQKKVMEVLDSKTKTIGVLKKKDTEFLNSLKSRSDILILEVNKENRADIEEKIKLYWKL